MKRRKYDAASVRRMRLDGLREGASRINKVVEKTENPSLIQKVKKALKAVADPTNASAKFKLAGVLGALGAALVFANHMVDKKNKENMAHNARVIDGMRRMAKGMERFTRQPLALPNPSNPAHRATRANRGIPGRQRSLGI